jgi:hypothetical protein
MRSIAAYHAGLVSYLLDLADEARERRHHR